MTSEEIQSMARQAIATLAPRPAAFAFTDNGDGTITIYLYGGGVLTWPPTLPTTTPTRRENALPTEPEPPARPAKRRAR